MNIEGRIAGSLLSGALADAIGSNFENKPAGTTYTLKGIAGLAITDDTQLTLATCEAIVASGDVQPEVIAAHFLKAYKETGIRGIGSSTLKALRDLEVGSHWYLAGSKSEMSAGNGAAMRIAPLGFCTDIHIDDFSFVVRDVCSITHKNDEAYVGALSVAQSVRLACEGKTLEDLKMGLLDDLPDTRVRDALEILSSVKDLSILDASKLTGTSGYVVESVPLALFSAMKAEEIGILNMIAEIVYCGGDTDTIASIAAQIAGAYLGPPLGIHELLGKVKESEYVTGVTSAFINHIIQKND